MSLFIEDEVKNFMSDDSDDDVQGAIAKGRGKKLANVRACGIPEVIIIQPPQPSGAAKRSSNEEHYRRQGPDFAKPTGNIITVRVGEGSWEIHRKVLARSPYFERILKEEDLSRHEDGDLLADTTITFDQTTSDIFGLFNRWSYKDHIKEQNGKYPTVGRMIRLWVLGSILELPALQDLVMTGLCTTDSVAGPSDYEYIYTNSNAECKLRRWSVDAIAANVSRDEMKGGVKANLTRMPKPMLIDLVISLKKLVPEQKERIDKGKYMVQRSVKRRDV